jgi:hypothetical protein
MGLFSSKTVTVVSSVVYNLAGEDDDRMDVVKSTIIGSILSGKSESMGKVLQSAAMNGGGSRQRSFFSWAQRNIPEWMPTAAIENVESVSTDVVIAGMSEILTLAENQVLYVKTAVIDDPDLSYWAEDWVRKNRPELTDNDWFADFSGSTGEILIQVGEEPVVRVPATADHVWALGSTTSRRLLFADYTIVTLDPVTGVASESDPEMFVYRMGSGNATFDALSATTIPMSEFYPAIPMRLNNKSIREAGLEDTYETAKKAYKKMFSGEIDTMLDSIETNENVGDIDYAFIVQGVPLNTKNNVGRAYIFKFIQKLMENQYTNAASTTAFINSQSATAANQVSFDNWLAGNVEGSNFSPSYGTAPASTENSVTAQATKNSFRVYTADMPEFDLRLSWDAISESQHAGNAKGTVDPAKVGDYWFEAGESFGGSIFKNSSSSNLIMYHQYSPYMYSKIVVRNFKHENYVYKNKAVKTSVADAFEEEDDSGFIIPLHYPTVRSMGIIKGNELSTNSGYILFNTYQQYKVRWYQRGIFKVIFFIVMIGISIFFPPAGAAFGGTGILGGNLALGVALGATTAMTAIILGAVANALAAMVVTTLISKGAVAIFGEKLGAIIGTLVSFVAMQYSAQFAAEGNFNVNWGNIFKAENLLKLTDSVSDAYAGFLNADTMEVFAEMENAAKEYEQDMERVENLSNEILGMTNIGINPMMFTDATEYFGESSGTFLSRTLLTGSDIATISLAAIGDFPTASLELPKAIL